MKEFLTDFYNKVVNFFQAEKVEGENSKVTAKNRLKLVLMQDRSNLEPETMAKLRQELVDIISKYIVIDKDALGLNLDGDGESMALMLNIPVVRAKTPEEIEEALAAAEKAKVAEEATTEETTEEAENNEEETVVEFSEGSIDEIECNCDETCECGCQDGEPCSCEGECECGCTNEEEQQSETSESEEATEEAAETDKKTKKK